MACRPCEEGLLDQHYFVYNDSKSMMGGTTAFQPREPELIWSGSCTPAIARDLSRLNKETLTWLVSQLPNASLLSCGATEASMVTHITSILPEHWAKKHPWIGRKAEVV